MVLVPLACSGEEGAEAPAESSSTTLPDDPVWIPGAELDDLVSVEVLEGTGEPSQCHSVRDNAMPESIAVSDVEGSVVAASVVRLRDITRSDPRLPWPDERIGEVGGRPTLLSHNVSPGWIIPEPGNRLAVDLDGSRALVVGGVEADFDTLVAAAERILASGDPTDLPGDQVVVIDGSTTQMISTAWAIPGSEQAVLGCGTPIGILTLETEDQLEALMSLGDPRPDWEEWAEIETVHSVPGNTFQDADSVDALGVTGTLMTFTARTRALFLPADPPVAVFSSNPFSPANDGLLVRVAEALEPVGSAELSDQLGEVRSEVSAISTTTTTFSDVVTPSTTTTTEP